MRRAIAALLAVALLLSLCAVAEKKGSESDAWVRAEASTVLRAKPDAGAEVVKNVKKGAEMDYLGKSKDGKWYKVKLKGKTGWIEARKATVKWSTFY